MKSWWHHSDREMYSTRNDGKYLVAEKFIKTLKVVVVNAATFSTQ